MLAAYFLQSHGAEILRQWENKNARSLAILQKPALRQMQPECVGDRTRLDLSWSQGKLGLRGPGNEHIDVGEPDTAHPVIVDMLRRWREDAPQCLDLASLRFRCGAAGEMGVWIDAANTSIKNLLDEKEWLNARLKDGWIVEIGQKRKHAVLREGQIKLEAAPALCWLPSYDVDNNELALRSHIALFSQPGPEVNRALIVAGFDLLDQAGIAQLSWTEWGAGYGNLSAAYASRLGGDQAVATEMEGPAAELLAQNAADFFPGVRTRQEAAESSAPSLKRFDLWLIDPPRPGFGALLQSLKSRLDRPTWVLAYHCHEQGLASDAGHLREAGYHLAEWSSVDAFPATEQHEVISLWRRPKR